MDTSVNAANQVVSVGADIAFDADPKFFACLVRFESSSVPTTLPTAYDVYPFVFQAEDGIRARNVTGVQTCALPIFGKSTPSRPRIFEMGFRSLQVTQAISKIRSRLGVDLPMKEIFERTIVAQLAEVVAKARKRSEERRVGKESK